MPAPQRVRGPLVVLGLSVLILSVVGFAFGMWWSKREPRGPILAAAPIGEGRVAMLRRGFEERGYVHLVVEEGSRQLWSEALFGVPEAPSITRFGDHVVLRAREARGHVEVHAFDARTGEFRWRGARGTHETPTENPQGLPPFAEHALFATTERLYVVHGGVSAEVVVLDREGEERGRVELPPGDGPRRAGLFGDELLIEGGDGILRRVDERGALREVGASNRGWCATARALYLGDDAGLARLPRQGARAVLGDGIPILVHACGAADDDWLVVTAPNQERALQLVGPEGLRGGLALPSTVGTTALRLIGEHLVAPCGSGGFDVYDLNAEGTPMRVDGADEVAFVGASPVTREGATVTLGERSVEVPGARGLATDHAHVFVWTERQLRRFDSSLRPLP